MSFPESPTTLQLVLAGLGIFSAGVAVGHLLMPATAPATSPGSADGEQQASGPPTGAGAGTEKSAAGASGGDDDVSEDGSDSDDDVPPGPLKQALVVRTDLGMKKGKQCAQCCHASLGSWKVAVVSKPAWVEAWDRRGCAKIALKCPSEDLMDAVAAKCVEAGLPCYIVEDAGHTQVAPGSRTVLGIGPAPADAIDAITGRDGVLPLKLL